MSLLHGLSMALMYQSEKKVGWRGEVGERDDTWCRQSRTIPGVYKRELPSQVRWMRRHSVSQ